MVEKLNPTPVLQDQTFVEMSDPIGIALNDAEPGQEVQISMNPRLWTMEYDLDMMITHQNGKYYQMSREEFENMETDHIHQGQQLRTFREIIDPTDQIYRRFPIPQEAAQQSQERSYPMVPRGGFYVNEANYEDFDPSELPF